MLEGVVCALGGLSVQRNKSTYDDLSHYTVVLRLDVNAGLIGLNLLTERSLVSWAS